MKTFKYSTKRNVSLFLLFVASLFSLNLFSAIQVQQSPTDPALTQINKFKINELAKDRFQILVWNVYGGKLQGFENDLNTMIKDSDFYLLQEANLTTEMQNVLGQINSGWMHATSFTKLNKVKMGVSTGSLISPINSTPFRSKNRELGFTTRKTSLITTYKIKQNKQNLMIVNTHAINFRGSTAFKEEIDRLVLKMKGHQGPLIFAGDFNTWSKARADYLVTKVVELKLKEVPFKKQRSSSPFDKTLPLDRAFYRGLKLIDSEVLDQIQSSDHLPLKIMFEL
jgi:endonuclease/exonuclease/phosphatase (EEP) superfamily protein YafD